MAKIVQARAQANRRGVRYISAEDLIFLIRHDRAKVNRLRTYLSWKDVRKHAKDSNADGGGGVEVENLEDGADGTLSISIYSWCYAQRLQTSSRRRLRRLPSSFLGKSPLYTRKF